MPRSVSAWVEECSEAADHRELSIGLYRHYQDRCAEAGSLAETQVAFGRALSRMGFDKTGNIWRKGIRLIV